MTDVKYNYKAGIPIRKQIAMKGSDHKGAPFNPLKLATGGHVSEHERKMRDAEMSSNDKEYTPKSPRLNKIMEREAENHAELKKMLKKSDGGNITRTEYEDPTVDERGRNLKNARNMINIMGHRAQPFADGGRTEAKGGKWIQKAIKHPGALHKQLGIPEGQKIPEERLEKAAHSPNKKLAARARLAETLKGFKK